MILIGGDISKITKQVVQKVEEVEKKEGYIATVTLSTFDKNIFVCRVSFGCKCGHTKAFIATDIYEKGSRQLVYRFADGTSGDSGRYETLSNWVDARREFPECPEHLASEVLFDLFVKGWD